MIGLLGEGFDDARLDTLFLVLPIAWRGTVAQYAGRLNRNYDLKREVIIYDYVDIISRYQCWQEYLENV